MNPATLVRLIQSAEFGVGALTALVLFALVLVTRERLDWGAAWAIASVSGLWISGRNGRIEALAYLGATGLTVALVGVVVAAAALRRWRLHGALAWAWAVSLGGIWATVPDTEEISVLLGAASVLVWLAWPLGRSRLSTVGVFLLPTVALAAGWAGSAGRSTALVGVFGSLGALALLGVPAHNRGGWLDLLFHTGLVLAWSRLAGPSGSTATAILIGAAATVALLGLKLLVTRAGTDDHSGPPEVVGLEDPPQ